MLNYFALYPKLKMLLTIFSILIYFPSLSPQCPLSIIQYTFYIGILVAHIVRG